MLDDISIMLGMRRIPVPCPCLERAAYVVWFLFCPQHIEAVEKVLAGIPQLSPESLVAGLTARDGTQAFILRRFLDMVSPVRDVANPLIEAVAQHHSRGVTQPPFAVEALRIVTSKVFEAAKIMAQNRFQTAAGDALHKMRSVAGATLHVTHPGFASRPPNTDHVSWDTANKHDRDLAVKALDQAFPNADLNALGMALRDLLGASDIRNDACHPDEAELQLSNEARLFCGVKFLCLLLKVAIILDWSDEQDKLVELIDRTVVWYCCETDRRVKDAQAKVQARGEALVQLPSSMKRRRGADGASKEDKGSSQRMRIAN